MLHIVSRKPLPYTVPLIPSDCKSFWWTAANLSTVTITFYQIFFWLLFKTECCNLPGSVLGALGTYTAMSLDVVQTILCVQHSKHLISMVWDSWCMLIQLFSLVLYPLLKNCIPLKYFSVYLFSTNPSQKKQPSSSCAGCPKCQELLRKIEILQSHTDFIAFAVTVCLQLLTVLSAEVWFIVICLLNLDWTELGFSITGLFRGWIFHTLLLTSMIMCRK